MRVNINMEMSRVVPKLEWDRGAVDVMNICLFLMWVAKSLG